MTEKRRWREFPRRFKQRLDATATVVGLGGIGLGAAGWGVLAPPFTLVAVGVGAAIALSSVGYSAFKAIPPKLVDASDLLGKNIPVAELGRLSAPIPTISIIGPSQAGKTTLRNRLTFVPNQPSRTDRITAQVVSLPVAPARYVAILDGGGHVYQHQFELAELCDHLCVVLDHSSSDSNIEPDNARIDRHLEFLEQVSNSIRDYRSSQIKSIILLWNKRDLWERNEVDKLKHFTAFKEEVIRQWNQARYARSIENTPHSNEYQDDIAKFVKSLIENTSSTENF